MTLFQTEKILQKKVRKDDKSDTTLKASDQIKMP